MFSIDFPVRRYCTVVFCCFAIIAVLLTPFPVAEAQSTGVSDTTSTPVAGVPHDYLDGLNEVVNPANGALSIRIKAPTPHERGVNWPTYAFTWDSNNQYTLQPTWTSSTSGSGSFSALTELNVTPQSGQSGSTIQESVTLPSGEYTTTTYSCNVSSEYVFYDPDLGLHPLGLNDGQPVSGYPSNSCSYFANVAYYPVGGDEQYKAILNATTTQATVSLVDLHGNIPEQEDSNGNYLNTTGRTWSLNDTSTGYTLTAPGVSTISGKTYSYNFTTEAPVNPSFSLPLTVVSSTSGGRTCQVSSIPVSVSLGSQSNVVKTIELPNGESYTFQYDPVYGLINQIIYPTGATVTYTWSPISAFQGVEYASSGFQCALTYSWFAITKRVVSFTLNSSGVPQPSEEDDFNYNTSWPAAGGDASFDWTTKTTTVTTKDLVRGTSFKTVYTYSPVSPPPTIDPYATWGDRGVMPLENTIQYYDTTGSLLKTVTKTWQTMNLLSGQCETLPNGSTAGTFYKYQPYTGFSAANQVVLNPNANLTNLPTDVAEFDYGAVSSCTPPAAKSAAPYYSTALRETVTAYHSFGNTPLFPYPSILDRPDSVKVYGQGTLASETDYVYDGATPTPVSSIPYGHDETNYGAKSKIIYPRGNATTITRKCFAGSKNCTDSTTTYVYDTTGQVLTATDALGYTTGYSYTDSYTTDNGSPPSGYTTNAYVTTITRPKTTANHISSYQYGFNDGRVRNVTDENQNPTQYCFWTGGCSGTSFDSFYRLTGVIYPDTGQKQILYSDAGPQPSVTDKTLLNGTTWLTKETIYDPYGHATQTQLQSDPRGTDYVDTVYDGLGRIESLSNPYRASGDPLQSSDNPTDGVTTYTYDALGRKTLQVQPDSIYTPATKTTPATNSVTQQWSYSGQTVTFTNELGNQWAETTDALGRLTVVVEPGPLQTTYGYDPLNNLIDVTQKGTSTKEWHNRHFNYDSLSRLRCASNPETSSAICPTTATTAYTPGTTGYTYDLNGNVSTKTFPAPNSPAGSTSTSTITYQYDVLNRLTFKSYSDQTPPVTLNYDESSATIGDKARTPTNPVGRLTSELVGSTTSPQFCNVFFYDPVGRPSTYVYGWGPSCGKTQTSVTGPYDIYQYDLAGNLISDSAGYRTYAYTYNGAGQVTSLTTSKYAEATDATLVSNATYDPLGQEYFTTLGNGAVEKRYRDNRQRLVAQRLTPPANDPNVNGPYLNAWNAYYDEAGNVTSMTDNYVMGNWSYGYDALNRLTTAYATKTLNGYFSNQGCQYTYDSFGNRTSTAAYDPSSVGLQCANTTTNYTPTSNQATAASGFKYDAPGNLIYDGTYTYTYDSEGRVSSLSGSGTTASYQYNAEGQRVTSIVNGATTLFGRDVRGQLRTRNYGPGYPEEIYLNGRHFGSLYANTDNTLNRVEYSAVDWLGTERARFDSSANLLGAFTSDPFGDVLATKSGTDDNTIHLTGKERDTESGLDYFGARYYASNMGRFLSADYNSDSDEIEPVPYANLENPQTLNLYSYVRNNPLSLSDDTGHVPCGGSASVTITVTPNGSSMSQSADDCPTSLDLWSFQLQSGYRNFVNNWNQRIDAHAPPQQASNTEQVLQAVNNVMMGLVPAGGVRINDNVRKTLESIDQTGQAPPGHQGGREFMNDGRGGGEQLPTTDASGQPIKYREWDVNPKQPGVNRGGERLVTGSNGKAYVTSDHYQHFTEIR